MKWSEHSEKSIISSLFLPHIKKVFDKIITFRILENLILESLVQNANIPYNNKQQTIKIISSLHLEKIKCVLSNPLFLVIR